MQFEVDPMHRTQENGQKPCFWLFGSFKKAFLWLLNDPAWVIRWPTHAHHLVLSKYAISDCPNGPNPRKRSKTDWIIQKYKIVIIEWSRFFPDKRPCTFLSFIKICNIELIRCSKCKKLAETHMDHSKGLKRVDASHGKLFKKRTVFFPDMRFSRWYS